MGGVISLCGVLQATTYFQKPYTTNLKIAKGLKCCSGQTYVAFNSLLWLILVVTVITVHCKLVGTEV